MEERIDPKQLLKNLSVEDFCMAAEEFYKSLADPTPQMAKPFSILNEMPDSLCKLGLLLSGLKLGKSMVVLDFGAGTCWLSRFLNQAQFSTISVDCSTTALNIGKKLFERSPIIGEPLSPPQFIPFDGHHLDIENESVDRIICFDTFHHIPNQREILQQFFRVLKTGGIAGFSEPGLNHSRSPQSQYEMRNYHLLENDILLDEIKKDAEEIGFGDMYAKLTSTPDLELSYNDFAEIAFRKNLPGKVQNHLFSSMENSIVFFLTKGNFIPDSRSPLDLKHAIEMPVTDYRAEVNQPVSLDVTISNTGRAKWLHQNTRDIGVVKLGMHLYDSNKKLVNLDFFRNTFEEDILPGQKIMKRVFLTFSERGKYYLAVDLVSEHICWFESFGSKPKLVQIIIA